MSSFFTGRGYRDLFMDAGLSHKWHFAERSLGTVSLLPP